MAFSLFDSDESKNLDAIKAYFEATEAKTQPARLVKDEFTRWYDQLGFLDRSDSNTYDHARNLRNEFNEKNAVTSSEKAAVKQVESTGVTTEETEGQPRRETSEGRFPEKPPESNLSKNLKIAGVAAGLTIIAIAVFKKAL